MILKIEKLVSVFQKLFPGTVEPGGVGEPLAGGALCLIQPAGGASKKAQIFDQATQTFRDMTATDIANTFGLASPALTGTPTAPTASVNTNTTQLATTAFTIAQIFNLGISFGYATGGGTTPAPTKFVANSDTVASINTLVFNANSLGGNAQKILANILPGSVLVLQGLAGMIKLKVGTVTPGTVTQPVSIGVTILHSDITTLVDGTTFLMQSPSTSVGVVPAADNTYASPTSITIKNGIITAIS